MPRFAFKKILITAAFCLSWTCVLIPSPLHADEFGSSKNSQDMDDAVYFYENASTEEDPDYSRFYNDEDRIPWLFLLTVNGGYNQLLKGYKGYDNLGNAGIDLYMRPGRLRVEAPGWKEHLMFRLSADYFPLQVPEGVYGLTEDMYGISGALLFKAFTLSRPESDQWVPFLGIGVGHYLDRVTLDTPASGKIAGTHNHFGANASLGLFTPVFFGRLHLIPEIRFHTLKIPDDSWSMNLTYQAGLAFQF